MLPKPSTARQSPVQEGQHYCASKGREVARKRPYKKLKAFLVGAHIISAHNFPKKKICTHTRIQLNSVVYMHVVAFVSEIDRCCIRALRRCVQAQRFYTPAPPYVWVTHAGQRQQDEEEKKAPAGEG